MANVILNEALGFGRVYIQNVEDNSPAAAVLRLHAWAITATDATLRDVTDGNVDDFEAITNVAEAANTGYANQAMDETDITVTVDDTNDRVDFEFTNQTFSSVAGDDVNFSDLTLSYDADGTDTDTTTKVLFVYDFVVTPNGGDIVADFVTTGDNFRVAQA